MRSPTSSPAYHEAVTLPSCSNDRSPYKALNFGGVLEYYLPGQGLIPLVGFYQKLDDPIDARALLGQTGPFAGQALTNATVSTSLDRHADPAVEACRRREVGWGRAIAADIAPRIRAARGRVPPAGASYVAAANQPGLGPWIGMALRERREATVTMISGHGTNVASPGAARP